MSYMIFTLIFLAVCLFVLSGKNKYILFLGFMIVSIIGILFSMLNFIFKTGYYNYTNSVWGAFDYDMYLKLAWLRLDYYTNIRLFNVFVALYMLSVLIFIFLYFRSVIKVDKKKFCILIGIFFVFPIYTVWFYDPYTSYMLYTNIAEDTGGFVKGIVFLVDILNYIVMFAYVIVPLFVIVKSLKNSPGFINKKRAISILVCLLVVNMYFLVTIFMGFFRRPYILEPNFIAIQRVNNMYDSGLYMLFTIMSIFLIGVMLFVVNKFSMTGKIGLLKRMIIRRDLNAIDKNYINLFHSVKNIIYSYKFSVEKIKATSGDEQDRAIEELSKKIDDYVERLSLMLNVITNKFDFELEKISLNELVYECIETMKIDDTIKIEITNKASVPLELDTFYMRDVLTNIVQNSLDAINKVTDKRRGHLTFETDSDGEWSILKISDNGIGMTKETIKNLFKPFYTTKSRVTNWGVGLSFSNKIVRFHGGYISVESRVGYGSDVYIYLPIKHSNVRKIKFKKLIK